MHCNPPHSLGLGQFRPANSPYMHIFVGQEKTEYLERSHKGRWGTCQLHTDSGPCLEFSYSHQRYNETTLNEMIFKDPLYFIKVSLPLQSLNPLAVGITSTLLISLSSDNYNYFLVIILQCHVNAHPKLVITQNKQRKLGLESEGLELLSKDTYRIV